MPFVAIRFRVAQSVLFGKVSFMAIRAILAPLSGGPASEGTIETACRLAKRFGAHVEALHVRSDPRQSVTALGPDMTAAIAAELIDQAARESEDRKAKAKAAFDAAIARHELPLLQRPSGLGQAASGSPSAAWREELDSADEAVARRARVSDLVVLGQSGRVTDQPHTDTLEKTLLKGGHPVLVAPTRPIAPLGEVIAVAWNGSVEAARAVSAALPFLAQAKEVNLLSAGDSGETRATAELAEYLVWHGIASSSHAILPVTGIGTGELILEAAREQGADLLVMGGYGRAVWREMLFGGATREVVGSSRLPLLLCH
jgi:nucleotide-binding universal stress UspA family protein